MDMAFMSIKQVIMRGTGRMIELVEKAYSSIMMGIFIKANGQMISLMGKEYIKIKRVLFMKAGLKMERRVAMVYKNGLMVQNIRVNSGTVNSMESVTIYGMIIQNIEEIGLMTPLKVKALTSGKTDDHLKAPYFY